MQRTTALLIAAWLLVFGAPARGDPTQVNAFCARPLRVALFEFGLLYRSTTQDGIDARLLDELEKRTGCKLVRVLMPRARIWAELQNGTLDMATAAVATPERMAYTYMLPYLQTRNVLLVRREVADEASSLRAFEASALRLGVVRSLRHEPAFDAVIATLETQKRVVEASDVEDLVRMLQRRVVDAIFCPPIVFPQYLSPDTLKQQIVVRDWAPKDQIVTTNLTLTHKSFTPDQADRWNQLLETVRQDGTLHTIASAFMAPTEARNLFYTGKRQRIAGASK